MKSNFKKITVLFSLLFILLISLAFVSAEDMEIPDSVGETSVSDCNLDLAESDPVITEDSDSDSSLSTAVLSDDSSSDSSIGQSANSKDNDENDVLSKSSAQDSNSNLQAVTHDYSISVNDVSGTESTNVNIVANLKDNGNPVSSGYVRFLLWRDGDTDVDEWVQVSGGQAILTIKLPSVSNLEALNWICQAGLFDESLNLLANTTFLTQIKRAVNPTTVLTGDIVGKMGKKVTLVANVYDADGLKVNTGTLTFKVNGKSYTVAVKNGKASKTITSPFLGIYTVSAKYNGAGAYKASTSKFKLVSDLKVKYSYYKSLVVKKGAKKYYKITLVNYYTKKALKSFKVKFKVKVNKKTWKTYTLKSNSKGIIKWSTKKLSVGTHSVKICSAYKYFSTNLKGKIVVRKK